MVLPPMGLTLVSLALPTGRDQVGWAKAPAVSEGRVVTYMSQKCV